MMTLCINQCMYEIPTAMHLTILGYRVVSRRHLTAARVDRPDWREYARKKWPYSPAVWDDADFYRRCISKDWVQFPSEWLKEMINSSRSPVEYVPFRESIRHIPRDE